MEPRDVARVKELCRAQNERDGTSYPVPPVFDADGKPLENIALALVTEVDGEVTQGHVFLRTIEEMSFGGGARDMAFSRRHIRMTLELLKRKGYNSLHIQVPYARVADLEKMLEAQGLKRDDYRLAHFFKQF